MNNILPLSEKIKRLPLKTFAFETINDYGTLTKGYFEDCKLIDQITLNKHALYVKKIVFVANTTTWKQN